MFITPAAGQGKGEKISGVWSSLASLPVHVLQVQWETQSQKSGEETDFKIDTQRQHMCTHMHSYPLISVHTSTLISTCTTCTTQHRDTKWLRRKGTHCFAKWLSAVSESSPQPRSPCCLGFVSLFLSSSHRYAAHTHFWWIAANM